MADFLLDWASASANGTTTLTSGEGTVDVTVSTPATCKGGGARTVGDDSAFGDSALVPRDHVSEPVTTTITFDQPVENVSFTLFDVDASNCRWDDQVTILAYDADGNVVEVQYSDLTAYHEVDGNTVGATGGYSGGSLAGVGDADSVSVSIPGPIVSIELIYDNGDMAQSSGTIGYSDIAFDLCAPPGDGIVEGTDCNDLIDTAYTGDPEGDRIDNNDALLPGEAPQDDIVLAGRGNDTVLAGEGDDEVYGEAGHDSLLGGEGHDQLYGGDGNDTIIGGTGSDTMYGGDDRDTFVGGNAGDVVDGGACGDDYDTLDLRGAAEAENPGGSLSVVYDDDDPEDGTVYFRDSDGNVTGTLEFTEIENVIPCFTPGTLIATIKGEKPVEQLAVGDKIITRDNGIQEIRWIGQRALNGRDLSRAPHLKPILVQAGSLGNGLPERDMLVSPNHRLLVANDRTSLYFEEHEVLAAAKHLVNHKGIQRLNTLGTTYIHFMFDRHEVVLSNGAWTESFQPGDYTLRGMGNAQRNEIFEIFPELKTTAGQHSYTAARKTLKKHEASLLLH